MENNYRNVASCAVRTKISEKQKNNKKKRQKQKQKQKKTRNWFKFHKKRRCE